MTYLAWVAIYEGQSDAAYFDVLLPRLMDEITREEGTRYLTVPQTPALRITRGRGVEQVAGQLCQEAESFQIIFAHTDTGGRNLEAALDHGNLDYCRAVHDRCGWPATRCVALLPRRETEAWVLADPEAVLNALGVTGEPKRHGLPLHAAEAEGLPDPKAVLSDVVRRLSRRNRRRDASTLFARIAQHQMLDALRGSRSFRAFEAALRAALVDLGYLSRQR